MFRFIVFCWSFGALWKASEAIEKEIQIVHGNEEDLNYFLLLAALVCHSIIFWSVSESEWIGFLSVSTGWLLAAIPATIAYKKGRNFFNWWFYGFLLLIVAVLHSSFLKETDEALVKQNKMKKCPACAEIIKPEAKKCKHCGSEVI